MRICLLSIVILLFSYPVRGQSNFCLRYFGITMHPEGNPQWHLMPTRLDDEGKYVMNYGLVAGYEKFTKRDWLSWKVTQGLYTDSGFLPAGHTHIGFRVIAFPHKRFNFRIGFGPSMVYRKSWYSKEDYVDTHIFKHWKGLQYKFVWYGGELEFDYRIGEKWDISANFLPGMPLFVSINLGVRYWLANRPGYE